MDITFNSCLSNQFLMLDSNKNSTRSPMITLELHSYIKDLCQSYLGIDYEVICQDSKEYKANGIFSLKNLDIAILKNNEPVGAIEVKAIRQSYNKNANNYFENMIGETANLRLAGIKVCQVILLPDIVWDSSKLEYQTNGDTQLLKYKKLMDLDITQSIRPNKLLLWYVSVDYNTYEVYQSNYNTINDKNLKLFLQNMYNYIKILKDFCDEIKGE